MAGPTGPSGPAGPAGPAGAPGTARAYARVLHSSCGAAPTGTCGLDNDKGVAQVIHRGTGVYCVVAPGINSNETTAAVTLDSSTSVVPRADAEAFLLGDSGICPNGAFVVETRQATGDNFTDSVGFTIVIP